MGVNLEAPDHTTLSRRSQRLDLRCCDGTQRRSRRSADQDGNEIATTKIPV
jgi:hypothetical protein